MRRNCHVGDGVVLDTTEPVPLGIQDRAILEFESATIAGQTCKVLRLGAGTPGVAELRARIGERLELTPPLRWRLGGGQRAPVWEPDPAFDLADHVVEHRHANPIHRLDQTSAKQPGG